MREGVRLTTSKYWYPPLVNYNTPQELDSGRQRAICQS